MKMKKENSAVKAESTGSLLAVNLILMVLSCVLFVGTTLAWFTDQTSGGVNRIQAGNLEAELRIGETQPYTSVKLDPPSGAQPVDAGTAVPLQLHKLKTETGTEGTVTNVTISTNPTDVWNPGDIFISDVMQVVKAAGSVPFKYKLKMLIDPETEALDENSVPTNDASDAGGEANAAESPTASAYIDFRIVKVDEISSLSSGDNPTRTYDYSKIAAYFPPPVSQPETTENDLEKTNELTEPTPIIWSSDNEEQTTPTNVFSSELAEGQKPACFVILAKLKPDVSVDTNSTDTIENPFSLIVTLKQLNAEHFEPAAEAGDAS